MNISHTSQNLQSSYTVSVLAALRALVPRRALTNREAERIAELQANRFRELLGLREPSLPEEAITSLPRIAVSYDFDLPVSGLAQWSNGRWLIAINGQEPEVRQRFSLAHELFHIVNHTTQQWLHPDGPTQTGSVRAERLADFFAACLLMPKRQVKRMFYDGGKPEYLAAVFEVSPLAMQVRLSQLGLVEVAPRCLPMPTSLLRSGRIYHRGLPQPANVAAYHRLTAIGIVATMSTVL